MPAQRAVSSSVTKMFTFSYKINIGNISHQLTTFTTEIEMSEEGGEDVIDKVIYKEGTLKMVDDETCQKSKCGDKTYYTILCVRKETYCTIQCVGKENL